ncbi:MAG: BatA domain-containing protein [Pirellulales bacterium]
MSFLQPLLLAALPLAALPIIIHLINQRRFQTIDWGAMRFLFEATRMSRGYARIRQWLILLFRVLAITALVIAVSRPLASGWVGLMGGGRADTTLVLIDRSPSMMQQGTGTVSSKIETAVSQLSQALATLGSSRLVVIDSAAREPQELSSPEMLAQSPAATATSASADLPALLQAAHDYIKSNRTGQTDIWICSDLRANDWDAESGRWKSLRDSFLEFKQGVRFHLLAYPELDPENVAIEVTNVRRQKVGDSGVLLVSLRLSRTGGDGAKRRLPVSFEIDGARSEIPVDLATKEIEIKDHPIPLESDRVRGWGRVSIPADRNSADDEFYFVFDEPPPRRTIIVADQEQEVRPLTLAAEISPDPAAQSVVEVIQPSQLSTIDWSDVALLLWHSPLPEAEAATEVEAYIERGGRVMFFPPAAPSAAKFAGLSWESWVDSPEPLRVQSWRGDQDLWARAQSGAALPVGELLIQRHCQLAGEFTALATLAGGDPLLARAPTPRGGIYFCATTCSPRDSSLATNGVALYVAVQRALMAGTAELVNTSQLVAGHADVGERAEWTQVAGPEILLSNEFSYQAGVYAVGERTIALNRDPAEERAGVLSDSRLKELFRGLDFHRVDDQAGSVRSLAQEIWRLSLAGMLTAMVLEAALCLPKRRLETGEPA